MKTKLFDVNLRLYKSNPDYKEIVDKCCDLIAKCAATKMDGYKKPHGMSGANIGIPFNIISIVQNRNKGDEYVLTMINPHILYLGGDIVEIESNCESIRLENPIKIKRREKVCISYYTFCGGELTSRIYKWFNRDENSLTIQHEIDHNLGILITDRQ